MASKGKLRLKPYQDLLVKNYYIPAFERIPNSSAQKKPLTIYHSVFSNATASSIESHLTSVGVVTPQWRYTMYSQCHFHSTSHEVLCVISGKARLCFGGEKNPKRVEPIVQEGDVIIVPAGVSHRLLEDLESGFSMVGSYPRGQTWDMCYGRAGEEAKVEMIESLDWFERDPIYADEVPVDAGLTG